MLAKFKTTAHPASKGQTKQKYFRLKKPNSLGKSGVMAGTGMASSYNAAVLVVPISMAATAWSCGREPPALPPRRSAWRRSILGPAADSGAEEAAVACCGNSVEMLLV